MLLAVLPLDGRAADSSDLLIDWAWANVRKTWSWSLLWSTSVTSAVFAWSEVC